MESYRIRGIAAILGTVVAVACTPALAQTASFTPLGDLGGGTSKAYAVSSDGTVVAGESLDGNGKTQAFIWTSSNGIQGIGFLDATYEESHGRGVDVDSGDTIHVGGYSLNSDNLPRAVHWSGNALGTGSYTAIPLLPNGLQSLGLALKIKPASGDEVYIVGHAEKANGAYWHAFRWRTGAPGDSLDLQCIFPWDHTANSWAHGVGFRPSGTNIIVGTSNSRWGGGIGGDRPEAFRWDPDWEMLGIRGLDFVCDRGLQVAAGPNGIAETTAMGNDVQVIAVGTTGLDPGEVIVSAGDDGHLATAEPRSSCGGDPYSCQYILGDDLLWPEGREEDTLSDSRGLAVSADGRFSVGRCTYPDETCENPHPKIRLFQANFHDKKMKGDLCNTVWHFPLGFLGDDNYSEALGVSTASAPDPSRDGVVVVGWSKHIGYRILAGANGIAESTAQCDDVQEIPVDTTGLASDAVVVSPGANGLLNSDWLGDDPFESYCINGSEKRAFVSLINSSYDLLGFESEMHDLKVYLEGEGLDLSEWELREARAVSNNGNVVVGWGLHNGSEEGFVASLTDLGPTGACCHDDGSCTQGTENECTGLSGQWQGTGTTCATVVCCPVPWADIDRDNDVDQKDFGLWQVCFSGGGNAYEEGCECFDRVDSGEHAGEQGGDGDVDTNDFAWFEDCFSGPTVPLDLENLPEDCIP